MRICVIGNSHVAALLSAKSGFPNVSFDFYAVPGGGGPNLKVKSGRLYPINDKTEVRSTIQNVDSLGLCIDEYDAILLSGVGMTAARKSVNNIHNNIIASSFLSASIDIGKIHQVLVSRDLYSIALEAQVRKLACIKTLETICKIYSKMILVQIFPLPSPSVVERNDFSRHYGNNLGSFFFMVLS